VLSVGGEAPTWAAATTADAEQVRAATLARLERLRAGLAVGKTPEQLGLRLLDPEQLAELHRGNRVGGQPAVPGLRRPGA
jgi:hypothetical protein